MFQRLIPKNSVGEGWTIAKWWDYIPAESGVNQQFLTPASIRTSYIKRGHHEILVTFRVSSWIVSNATGTLQVLKNPGSAVG